MPSPCIVFLTLDAAEGNAGSALAPGYLIYNIVTQQGLIRGNGGAPAGQIRLNAAGILGGSGTRQQAAVMPEDSSAAEA